MQEIGRKWRETSARAARVAHVSNTDETESDMTHTPICIENAEYSVRETCANQLVAKRWDEAAMAAEAEWVTYWAHEWLTDGTTDCRCN